VFPFSGACTSILGPAALIARPSEEKALKGQKKTSREQKGRKFPRSFFPYFEGFSPAFWTALKLEKEILGRTSKLQSFLLFSRGEPVEALWIAASKGGDRSFRSFGRSAFSFSFSRSRKHSELRVVRCPAMGKARAMLTPLNVLANTAIMAGRRCSRT
jgi:hypothetical protein